ncbi:MAG TPA: hypothetical protein VEO54_30820 [Thermoanaerobaculia bacterium]|nr:hypothetical protein [Thermoanaerobaculia bacterium]
MTDHIPQCERCRVPMERGYMIDHGYGVTYPMAWVAGVPRWSKWWGLKVKREEKIPVASYRCPQCGRLESYAKPGPWPT